MSTRFSAALFGVLALALLVAGCGGGSSETASASSLTKAEFIKRADAICAKGNHEASSEANEFAKENNIDTAKPTTAQQEEVVAEVVAPAIRVQAEKVSALGAPSGEEAEVEAIVSAVEKGADEAEAEPSSIVGRSSSGPFAEASKLAKAYGLEVCGQDG